MSEEHTPNYSTIPSTGAVGDIWPSGFNLTQGIRGATSQAGWKDGSEGYIQQTFLGASIRSFDVAAGFGDTSSNMSIRLVEDEYNESDQSPKGVGDDVYHDGKADKFVPPPVGSPVFFKFGKNFATVEQAWRKTIDQTYDITSLDTIEFDEVKQSGAFLQMPSGTNEMPEIKDKFYLKEETLNDKNTEDDDERIFVNKKELYEHDNKDRGGSHFCFGGILQSVVENRGPSANPAYTVQITDPREILSNCVLLLNNYAGTTFNNKNLFNIYGFLEYDPGDRLQQELDSEAVYKWELEKLVDNQGVITYAGVDKNLPQPTEITYNVGPVFKTVTINPSETNIDLYQFESPLATGIAGKIFAPTKFPKVFPVTGEGFSRRSDQGIPWYRVSQGLAALFEQYGTLPQEYKDAGFGGTIDFRGFNYLVDFSGLPLSKIPKTYFLDYSQIDLLSLVLELCDVVSHDLFVSLLPVVDPLTNPQQEEDEKAAIMNMAFAKNSYYLKQGQPENIIHGIIRLDAIDRSQPPSYGSIQKYINDLEEDGIHVENRDLGFELSNVTTDKFVAGAQEVEMYYFSTHKDRDNLEYRKKINGIDGNIDAINQQQWSLGASLRQQVLPFYGFLGKNAVSIPRGFGSYQQIMLDTQGLEAHGVGNYYIATELELRAAAVSFENWRDFLNSYNELFIEELTENKTFYQNLAGVATEEVPGLNDASPFFNIGNLTNREFGVSVPRCVFISDKNYLGEDGYPANPCAPPYGYPLYYKRGTQIGLPMYGVGKLLNNVTNIITGIEKIKQFSNEDPNTNFLQQELDRLEEVGLIKRESGSRRIEYLTEEIRECLESKVQEIKEGIEQFKKAGQDIAQLDNILEANQHLIANINRISQRGIQNAKKIHAFLKNVADENLGKKFLVKIPKYCNLNYSENIELKKHAATDAAGNIFDVTNNIKEIQQAPFGFRPIPVHASGDDVLESEQFRFDLFKIRESEKNPPPAWDYERFLFKEDQQLTYSYGALKGNYNPMTEKWAFNYKPEPQGGFFNFSLYSRNLSFSEQGEIPGRNLPLATQQQLCPKDLTNFIDDNGRLSCYVRYDNSQILDFRGVSADSFTQDLITTQGFIPDVLEDLDNVNLDEVNSMERAARRKSGFEDIKDTVAYVRCTVDERLYLTPKFKQTNTLVYGRTFNFVPNFIQPEAVEDVDEDGCVTLRCFQPYAEPIFSVGPNGGSDGTVVTIDDFERIERPDLAASLVHTEEKYLNSEHVYALITVPGRIIPTADQRFMDSILQSPSTQSIKHILTQDVVRGAPGFDKPAPIINKKQAIDCSKFTFEQLEDALRAQQDVVSSISLGNPELRFSFNEPSPVYPNLVALPLMSTERCYGPWLSSAQLDDSQDRYSDIGGKIEFVKDENLAPWNYAGYQLMNEAGKLQAEFSNSLLLFAERGGFVFPSDPGGVAVGQRLRAAGPLVTSVNVSVGDGGIKTTVKMDLYTSRFGKLQKQKEGEISRIAREREKIRAQNNEMIRNGLIRNSSRNSLAPSQSALKSSEFFANSLSNLEKGQPLPTQLTAEVTRTNRQGTDGETGDEITDSRFTVNASLQSSQDFADIMSMISSPYELFSKIANTVTEGVMENKAATTQFLGNPNLVTTDFKQNDQIKQDFHDGNIA